MLTWQRIHELLHMDSAHFRTQDEMDLGYHFMVKQVEDHGESWVEENRGQVIYEWEQVKEAYRLRLLLDKKKKKKRKRLSQ